MANDNQDDLEKKLEHLFELLDCMADKMSRIEENTEILETEMRQELEELRKELKRDR